MLSNMNEAEVLRGDSVNLPLPPKTPHAPHARTCTHARRSGLPSGCGSSPKPLTGNPAAGHVVSVGHTQMERKLGL